MEIRARKTTFWVSGLATQADVARVEAALRALPYVSAVVVDSTRVSLTAFTVTHQPDPRTPDLIKQVIHSMGLSGVTKG